MREREVASLAQLSVDNLRPAVGKIVARQPVFRCEGRVGVAVILHTSERGCTQAVGECSLS